MKTKLVIFAFGILSVLPLIRNIYLLSKVVVVVPPQQQQQQSQLSSLSLAASASLSLNDDESVKTQQLPPSEQQQPTPLDFAIIGFAKTGTTYLHQLLSNHTQIIMYPDEFWGDGVALQKWIVKSSSSNSRWKRENPYGHIIDHNNREGVDGATTSLVQQSQQQLQGGDGRGWWSFLLPTNSGSQAQQQQQQQLQSTPPPKKRLGIKCPRIIKETTRLDQLLLVNTSRVIVGVRHPVYWFESLYNYRIWQKHEKNRHKQKPTLKKLQSNSTDWLGLSTGAARFDLYLKQLGIVPLSTDELEHMKEVDKVDGVMNTTIASSLSSSSSHHHTQQQQQQQQHPMKVLLYTIEQIKDTNTTRRNHFHNTLQQFLNLDTPIYQQDISSSSTSTSPQIIQNKMVNVNTFQHDENINICSEQYTNIRNILVWQGKSASEWIRNKFMKSADVIVSDVEFMNEILLTWGEDPC